MDPATQSELLKAGLGLGVSLITLALGWLVGQSITMRWNLRQKQREFDLTSAQEFHRLYGEFFAVWKLWNYSLTTQGAQSGITPRELLLRACAAEGSIESILVRLASSRSLQPQHIISLGHFRQAYQALREAITDGVELGWHYDSHPKYTHLKEGATTISLLIVGEVAPDQSVADQHAQTLKNITLNDFES